MNEYEALHQILAAAISNAQLQNSDVKVAAKNAAEAFKAGLAAFGEFNPQASLSPPKASVKASSDKPRRK